MPDNIQSFGGPYQLYLFDPGINPEGSIVDTFFLTDCFSIFWSVGESHSLVHSILDPGYNRRVHSNLSLNISESAHFFLEILHEVELAIVKM